MATRVETEQAQVDPDVAVGLLDAAEAQDGLARTSHRLAVDREAREPEGHVGLDGRVDLGRPVRIDLEPAVGPLAVQDRLPGALDPVPRGRLPLPALGRVEPQLEQHVVGLESGVGEQIPYPVALRLLQRQQGGRDTGDGGAGRLG